MPFLQQRPKSIQNNALVDDENLYTSSVNYSEGTGGISSLVLEAVADVAMPKHTFVGLATLGGLVRADWRTTPSIGIIINDVDVGEYCKVYNNIILSGIPKDVFNFEAIKDIFLNETNFIGVNGLHSQVEWTSGNYFQRLGSGQLANNQCLVKVENYYRIK